MALMKKTQRSFSGGQLDKDLTGRQDLNKYSQGCLTLENFKVRKQGNVVKRSGTDLMCDFTGCLENASVRNAKLVPLIQDRDGAFYVLLTASRAFLVSNDGMKMTDGSWDSSPEWNYRARWMAVDVPAGHAFAGQPTMSDGTWSWTDTSGTVWTASGKANDVELAMSASSGGTSLSCSAVIGKNMWRTEDGCELEDALIGQPSYADGVWTWQDTQGRSWTAEGDAENTVLDFDGPEGENGFQAGIDAHPVPYSIAVPFDDADLATLDWCQSGDTVFFAHRSYPPGRLVYDNGSLTYTRIEFRQGLGNPPRIASVTQSGTGWTGTGGTVHLEYAVTAVKDGVETGMSVPYAVEYNAPWPNTGSYVITIDTSGLAADSWDCFYVYKKEADVFGLIGTTSTQKSFVDVSNGFSVNGYVYPSGFSTFDKQIHLRESGNKFATCYDVYSESKYTVVSSTSQQTEVSGVYVSSSELLQAWKNRHRNTSTTTSSSTTRSTSAQVHSPDGSNVVRFDIPISKMGHFTVGVGGLRHRVKCEYSEERTDKWLFSTKGRFGYVCATTPVTTIVRGQRKWSADYSEFHSCPAKWFKARITYDNDSQSSWFDCDSVVDQSAPGEEWVPSGDGVFRKTYNSSEYAFSYENADAVVSKMDAKQPGVGATVSFRTNFPSIPNGRSVKAVEIAGYAAQESSTAAALVVNGFACYQSGRYVNSFTDSYVTPDLTITPPKTEDHFVNPGEYPGCVQIYQQRLVYASSSKCPFTFWMSQTGDIHNFDSHEYVRASDAITASTAAIEMPRINRMLVHRDLMLFAEGGEWQVAPSSGNAVAPSTIAAKLQSTIGCASWLKPLAIDSDIVFCDSTGETLMATRYNFATDGYDSSNLSVLSQRIFRNNPIVAMAYAQFPESTIECVLDDGTVASLVYMKEHEVCAWSRHVLGGGWKAVDVAANKSVVKGSSHCAFVATRTYSVTNANTSSVVTKWAVLGLRDIDPNNDRLENAIRMDAVRGNSIQVNPPVPLSDEDLSNIPLPRMDEGERCVCTRRRITRRNNGVEFVSRYVFKIGFPFKSVIKTTSPEFTDKETAQMEVKNATEIEIRVIDGSDFTVRQADVPAEKATLMKVPSSVNTDPDMFMFTAGDADCKLPLVGTNTTNGSVIIEHDGVLPLSILSVSTAFRIEYSNHANGGSQNGRD